MDFGFSQEQDLLRQTARGFLEKECPSTFVRRMMDDPAGITDELWQKLAELGWLGLTYPEAHGGVGLGLVDLTVILEEMGRVVMPGPEASAGKIWWCDRHQALQDVAQELLGVYGQCAKGSPRAVDDGLWQYSFLRSRANSIEGGTTDIQRNIIGERVLGLPKD